MAVTGLMIALCADLLFVKLDIDPSSERLLPIYKDTLVQRLQRL